MAQIQSHFLIGIAQVGNYLRNGQNQIYIRKTVMSRFFFNPTVQQ
jgi:hypothetical protein